MASIVAQQQDLFFEFDFGEDTRSGEQIVDVSKTKDGIFLIGCFRNDQKHQIDWILQSAESNSCGKYNVRLGKGRDGWINKDNPRIANPQYVVLYEFGNEDVTYTFRVNGSKVYTEAEMLKSGYDTPKGDYLVYKLISECKVVGVDVKKVLSEYRERTNWVDGKPIYLTGREILSAGRPKTKRQEKKVQDAGMFAPYSVYIVVTETYAVDNSVDPVYSRIDQIFVLRKCKDDERTKNEIKVDVVKNMFWFVVERLLRPWSEVGEKVKQGLII